MPPLLADALVLVFTDWFSMRRWDESGQLDRDWALGDAVSSNYRRILLVTAGPASDLAYLPRLTRQPAADGGASPPPDLLVNDHNLPADQHLLALPARVAALLTDAHRVVVRTQHMAAGRLATRITDHLRDNGKTAGLFARGEYLWSRFAAHQHGTASPEAIHAASVEHELCGACDAFAGTTGKMVDDLAWRHGLDHTKGLIIPNYVFTDGPVYTAEEREPGLLVYSGSLIRRKRVELLIQAVSRLPEHTRTKVRLDIIGDGPEQPALARLAKNLGIPARFLPRLPHAQLINTLRRCQIFLHASELEGHPRPVIDAMAAGATVLVADTPGLGSVIQHGATGLRVSADPDAFANAITELLADDEWRDMLGAAAARVIRNTFGLDQIIPLELAAQQLALQRGTAHSSPTAPPSPSALAEGVAESSRPGEVRRSASPTDAIHWTPDLLTTDPLDAAEAWAHALRLYAANLSPHARFDFQTTLARDLSRPPRRSEAA